MVTQLIDTMAAWLRKRVADSVRAAILGGTADGINAAAESLGMLAAPPEPEPLPELKIVYVEPEAAPRKRVR